MAGSDSFYYIARRSMDRVWTSYAESPSPNSALRSLPGYLVNNQFRYNEGFGAMRNAIWTIERMRELVGNGHVEFGIMQNGRIVWEERGRRRGEVLSEERRDVLRSYVSCTVTQPQEENMSDIETPLNIKREDLIAVLETRLDEEKTKRETATAAQQANRQKVIDAIKTFTDDELFNIFNNYAKSAADATDFAQWVEKAKESKKYVSREQQPDYTESTLERTVRVLKLAANDTIEVWPTDSIYPLL